jgi:transposase
MSTSLVYHGFGIKGYHYVNTKYESGAVRFTIRQEPNKLTCSCCGARHVLPKGQVWRQFRDLPIGKKPVWITLGIHRVYCRACDLVRQVKLGFAEPRRSYTRGFERYALDLGRQMTIKDVARHLGVSWGYNQGHPETKP